MASISAFAAGASVESDTLASGSDAVARCDSTPDWTYTFVKNVDGYVVSVSVGAIDAACSGGQLSIAVEPGGAEGSASVSGCTTTCSASVTLDAPLAPDDVDEVDAIILGP
jgi:hypothetical protein